MQKLLTLQDFNFSDLCSWITDNSVVKNSWGKRLKCLLGFVFCAEKINEGKCQYNKLVGIRAIILLKFKLVCPVVYPYLLFSSERFGCEFCDCTFLLFLTHVPSIVVWWSCSLLVWITVAIITWASFYVLLCKWPFMVSLNLQLRWSHSSKVPESPK